MKIKYKNNNVINFCIILSVSNFLLLSYLKYDTNSLSLQNYSLHFIGNILNIIVSSLLIVGLIGLGFKKIQLDKTRHRFLAAIQIISLLALILVYILFNFISFANNAYLISFPIKKVYIGFLYIVSLLCQLYSLLYVWGIIVGLEKLFEMRTLLRTFFAVIVLIVFSLFYVWNVNIYTEEKILNEEFVFGVIPGAAVWSKAKPSPIFEGRIRKALDLYRKGIVKNLIVTGGNAPGEISEADAAFRYLTNLGVDPKKIITERETSTTIEQIKFLWFEQNYNADSSKVLMVSDGFHLARILQISNFFNIKAVGVASEYSLSFEKAIYYRSRECIALLLFWFFAI